MTTKKQIDAADQPALSFTISGKPGDSTRILSWSAGGCQPASDEEIAMWDLLHGRVEGGEGVPTHFADPLTGIAKSKKWLDHSARECERDRYTTPLFTGVPVADTKDAARYRWLRDKSAPTMRPEDNHKPWCAKVTERFPHSNELLYGPDLDAAIDSAMASKGEKG